MRKSRVLSQSKRKSKKHSRSSRKIRGGLRKESPFIKYAKKHREEVREQNPGLPFGELAVILTNNWKNLSDEEKSHYDGTFDPIRHKAKEASKKVLTEFKETVHRLKYDPTPNNASFVGEEYRAAEERWNKRNTSKESKSSKESNDSKSSSI